MNVFASRRGDRLPGPRPGKATFPRKRNQPRFPEGWRTGSSWIQPIEMEVVIRPRSANEGLGPIRPDRVLQAGVISTTTVFPTEKIRRSSVHRFEMETGCPQRW